MDVLKLSNISYTIIVNQIYGYLDRSISHSSVRYIATRYKQMKYKNNTGNRIQGGDIHRLFLKNWGKIDNHLC